MDSAFASVCVCVSILYYVYTHINNILIYVYTHNLHIYFARRLSRRHFEIFGKTQEMLVVCTHTHTHTWHDTCKSSRRHFKGKHKKCLLSVHTIHIHAHKHIHIHTHDMIQAGRQGVIWSSQTGNPCCRFLGGKMARLALCPQEELSRFHRAYTQGECQIYVCVCVFCMCVCVCVCVCTYMYIHTYIGKPLFPRACTQR